MENTIKEKAEKLLFEALVNVKKNQKYVMHTIAEAAKDLDYHMRADKAEWSKKNASVTEEDTTHYTIKKGTYDLLQKFLFDIHGNNFKINSYINWALEEIERDNRIIDSLT